MDLLSQMATFVRVVEGRSLSAAARAQRLSLPAVSRQLAALEADLGATLIVRTTRALHVTDAGQRWYEHSVRVLAAVDDARASVGDGGEPRGRVVVSAPVTLGMDLLVPALPSLTAKHPALRVDLRLEDQLVELVGDGVDVAVRAGPPPPDSASLVAQRLFPIERWVVASSRWARRHGRPRAPQDLATRPCVLQVTPAGQPVRWALRRGAESATVDVGGQLRTNAPLALRQLALDGAGAAFLPDWLVAADVAAGRLHRLVPAWTSEIVPAWALYRAESRGVTRVRAVLDALGGLADVVRERLAPAPDGAERRAARRTVHTPSRAPA